MAKEKPFVRWTKGFVLAIHILTPGAQGAAFTLGAAGDAGVTTEQHDPVAEVRAFLRGQDLPQLLLHLFGFFAFGKSQALADAAKLAVGGDCDAAVVKISGIDSIFFEDDLVAGRNAIVCA